MTTDAQFGKGQIVWYWTTKTSKELAVIVSVEQINPAQYHVAPLATSDVTVCGEGMDEPGAVSAL